MTEVRDWGEPWGNTGSTWTTNDEAEKAEIQKEVKDARQRASVTSTEMAAELSKRITRPPEKLRDFGPERNDIVYGILGVRSRIAQAVASPSATAVEEELLPDKWDEDRHYELENEVGELKLALMRAELQEREGRTNG